MWVHAQTTTGGGARGATAAENSAAQAAAQAVSRENGILDRAGDPFYPESASIPIRAPLPLLRALVSAYGDGDGDGDGGLGYGEGQTPSANSIHIPGPNSTSSSNRPTPTSQTGNNVGNIIHSNSASHSYTPRDSFSISSIINNHNGSAASGLTNNNTNNINNISTGSNNDNASNTRLPGLAPQPSPRASHDTVHKEIDLLKDKIKRLQASLYITELAKSNTSTSASSNRQSPAPAFNVNSNSNSNSNNIAIGTDSRDQTSSDDAQQRIKSLTSVAQTRPLTAFQSSSTPGVISSNNTGGQYLTANSPAKYARFSRQNTDFAAGFSPQNAAPTAPFSPGFRDDLFAIENGSGNGNFASLDMPNGTSDKNGRLDANEVRQVGASPYISGNNNNSNDNQIFQKGAEFSMLDNSFFDNFLRSFQKGEFATYLDSPDSQLIYSVPISLSNKFTFEEGELVLDLTKRVHKSKARTFDNFNYVCDSSNNILFAISFSLIWFVFEKDFYIKSAKALGCQEISPFLFGINEVVNDCLLQDNPQFMLDQQGESVLLETMRNARLQISLNDLKIFRSCIIGNINSLRNCVEPMVILPPPYLVFDSATSKMVTAVDAKYSVLEEGYVKALLKEIKKFFPDRKVTLLLMTKFFKTFVHCFPFLDKARILSDLTSFDHLFYDVIDFSGSEYRECLLYDSVGYTLDCIGTIFVVLRVSYLVCVDSLREKLYRANFNIEALTGAEQYLLKADNVHSDKFIYLAKCCFSYHFKFSNIYENFGRIDFALRKVQLGLFLLIYTLCFEDQMRLDDLLFKSLNTTEWEKKRPHQRDADASVNGVDDGKSNSNNNYSNDNPEACYDSPASVDSKSSQSKQQQQQQQQNSDLYEKEVLDNDSYTRDLMSLVDGNNHKLDHQLTPPGICPMSLSDVNGGHGRGYGHGHGNIKGSRNRDGGGGGGGCAAAADMGPYPNKGMDFLLSVQTILADANNTYATLIQFCNTLKLDRDPLDFIDLSLTVSATTPNDELSSTFSQIKDWRLTWLEMINFDKTFSMAAGKKPILDDGIYATKFNDFVNADDNNFAVENAEDRVKLNTLAKRKKVHDFVLCPMFKLNEWIQKKCKELKLKDYLSIVKSIDNYVEFHNDYKLNEVFDFIDGFKRRYPVFFEEYCYLNDEQKQQYLAIENRIVNKNYEIVHSLHWNITSTSIQFTIYYSLFAHLDRVICFERSNNDVPIFKKVFLNIASIISGFIKLMNKILGNGHYRKFICGHFKVLFKRAVEPVLLSLFMYQHGTLIRLIHTIKLLQDYINMNQHDVKVAETTEKLNLLFEMLTRTIASNGEILRLFKVLNNCHDEPNKSSLSEAQLDAYEKVNRHSFKTCTLFSSEAVSLMSLEHAFIKNLKLRSIDDIFDSDDSIADLFEVSSVKLKKFGTVNGTNIILPNFNSFLYFENHEIRYITNELMKDFGNGAPMQFDVTPVSERSG